LLTSARSLLRCARRLALTAVLSLALVPAHAAPPLVLTDLGRATIPLDGAWQFHSGDNLAWAQPAFDDSAWEPIRTGKTWEEQGHYGLTGFAWYRLRVSIPASASQLPLMLYLPGVNSACEIYWNGRRIGSIGRVPPNPVWYLWRDRVPAIAKLDGSTEGVLALRVWKAPIVYLNSPYEGGVVQVPQIGSAEAIAALSAAHAAATSNSLWFTRALDLMFLCVGMLALFTALRDRRFKALVWLAVVMCFPTELYVVTSMPGFLSFRWSYALIGPVIALNNLALWTLLLHLLGLNSARRLARWTRTIALTAIGMTLLDTAFQLFDWTRSAGKLFLICDVVSTIPVELSEFWGLVILVVALRKHLDAARLTLAITGLLTSMVQAFDDVSSLGARWTHWTGADWLAAPLLVIGGSTMHFRDILNTVFLISLLVVTGIAAIEQARRQSLIDQELQSAQELQRLLVPTETPKVEGFTLSSAYRPAREVGGDFFQVIPLSGSDTLVVLGDVSGKGLPAAIAVAHLVGALHSSAEHGGNPDSLLTALNRRLYGRLGGGFATCIALRISDSGECQFASAGHLPPYRNTEELPVQPALPLGLLPDTEYESTTLKLAAGDVITLYTDGIVEAQKSGGKLFGFAALAHLLASRPNAAAIADAAQTFGQEDDITVLSLGFG